MNYVLSSLAAIFPQIVAFCVPQQFCVVNLLKEFVHCFVRKTKLNRGGSNIRSMKLLLIFYGGRDTNRNGGVRRRAENYYGY